MPDENIAFQELMLPIAEGFKTKDVEGGLEIGRKIIQNMRDDLKIYFSTTPAWYAVQNREIDKRMDIYFGAMKLFEGKIDKSAGRGQEAHFAEMETSFDQWMSIQRRR